MTNVIRLKKVDNYADEIQLAIRMGQLATCMDFEARLKARASFANVSLAFEAENLGHYINICQTSEVIEIFIYHRSDSGIHIRGVIKELAYSYSKINIPTVYLSLCTRTITNFPE